MLCQILYLYSKICILGIGTGNGRCGAVQVEGIFALGNKFGLSKCSLLGQRTNSACRNARFWVSGGIRLAELLAFGSADVRAVPTTASFR